MKNKLDGNENELIPHGGCPYQIGVICGQRNCEKCGFNPDNGAHERRVEAAMREYSRKVNAGEVFPVY